MNWHNQLENFASRGLKAQETVDKIISSAAPASSLAAGGDADTSATPGPGVSDKRRPGPVPRLKSIEERITESKDERWLKNLMADRDQTPAVREAAQRRLRKMMRKPRL